MAAIVVHSKFEGDVGVFRSLRSSLSLEFKWCGRKWVLVVSHLCPYRDLARYSQDLGDVRVLMMQSWGCYPIWCIDAQTPLHPGELHSCWIGLHILREEQEKFRDFLDALLHFDLAFSHLALGDEFHSLDKQRGVGELRRRVDGLCVRQAELGRGVPSMVGVALQILRSPPTTTTSSLHCTILSFLNKGRQPRSPAPTPSTPMCRLRSRVALQYHPRGTVAVVVVA